MKRLLRILFNAATVLSLVLCVATVVLWVRSYWMSEQWSFVPAPPESAPGVTFRVSPQRWIGSSRGQLRLLEMTFPEHFPRPRKLPAGYQPTLTFGYVRAADVQIAATAVRECAYPGVEFAAMPAQICGPATLAGYRSLVISWWVPALTCSILPAFWTWRRWVRWRRLVRDERGLCPACGYDLRATPDRCPECGRILRS